MIPPALNDPDAVKAEYASEAGLLARRAAYASAEGPDAPALLFDAIASCRPRTLLEVGCGPGDLAARVQAELGADVVAIDISRRMVELARAKGVDARVADVQELPFGDESFDCAVAAWMLYHVPDLDSALDELRRVLRPGGTLVAVTNCSDHLAELRQFVRRERRAWSFVGEEAAAILRTRFDDVETIDASGTVTFPDREAVVAYVSASTQLFGPMPPVPELDEPLVVRRRPVILVARK